MLKTSLEVEQAQNLDPSVINGVDNANLMSVDSTEPVKGKIDEVDENGKVVEETEAEEEDGEAEDGVVDEEDEEEEEEEEEEDYESDLILESDSRNVQKRIGTLTKKFRSAERERDFEKSKRLELEARIAELEAQPAEPDKPQKEDYEDEDDYIEALTDWKIEQKLNVTQQKSVKEQKVIEERKAAAKMYKDLDIIMRNGKTKYEDFDELTLDNDLILSPEVVQITLDTEIPEDIMYFLASNPDESERISSLSPVKAAKEIGKIEVGFLKAMNAPKPKKKQSKAPEPIDPIDTTGVSSKDPSQMSMKEYRAWRKSK